MTFTHTLHVIQEGIQPIVAPIDNDAPVEPEGPQSDDDDDEPQSVLQGRLRALAEAGDDDSSILAIDAYGGGHRDLGLDAYIQGHQHFNLH